MRKSKRPVCDRRNQEGRRVRQATLVWQLIEFERAILSHCWAGERGGLPIDGFRSGKLAERISRRSCRRPHDRVHHDQRHASAAICTTGAAGVDWFVCQFLGRRRGIDGRVANSHCCAPAREAKSLVKTCCLPAPWSRSLPDRLSSMRRSTTKRGLPEMFGACDGRDSAAESARERTLGGSAARLPGGAEFDRMSDWSTILPTPRRSIAMILCRCSTLPHWRIVETGDMTRHFVLPVVGHAVLLFHLLRESSLHGHGQTRLAVQTAGLYFSVERNLRRPQRLLGLRAAGRRAEAQRQGSLVARHGHRPRRPGHACRRAGSRIEMVGLDCSIIMHPQVWKCSGHYDLFVDKMVDCRTEGCKGRFRVDHIPTSECPLKPSKHPGEFEKCQLTAPREFNLMFKTIIGALGGEEDAAFLRPETAQGIFVNFKNVCRQQPRENSVWHRADGQEFSQRNHAAELHLPHARIRADGNRVFLPSEPIARVVSVLARPADEVVYRSGPGERAAAAART